MQSGGGGRQERTAAIGRRLEEVVGEPLSGEVRRLSSGASRETFAFSTPRGDLVVQIARGAGNKLVNATSQGQLLRAAAETGVPVPAVVADGGDDEILGSSWTVVEALSGTTDPQAILSGEGAPGGEELIDGLAAALASIHRIDLDAVQVPAIEDPVALLREWYDRLDEPHPAFELAFRALQSERPAADRRTLVHGDFRMGNLMVGPDGLTGVLDWELAHAGDPAEDLGWFCVRAWRFGSDHLPAGGLGGRQALLDAYRAAGGAAIDAADLRFWEVYGTVRWGVMCVLQASVHLTGAVRSVELAAIGRRACEMEWALLELIA